MHKKMTKTDIAIRLLAIASVVCVVLSLLSVTTSAIDVTNTTFLELTVRVSNDDVRNKVVPMIYTAANFVGKDVYPLFITEYWNADDSTYEYRLYFVQSQYSYPGKFVSDIPEDWGRQGATIHFGSSHQMYYISLRPAVTRPDSNTYVYLFACTTYTQTTTVTPGPTSSSYQLNSNEQIIYMIYGNGPGENQLRTYTGVLPARYDKFVSACVMITRGIGGGGGYTQEDLDLAEQAGYQNGYEEGSTFGYTNGYDAGYQSGNQEGYDDGYSAGYDIGVSDGSPTVLDVPGIITAIPNGAREIINGALDFEIFGINVAGTLLAILVVAIVAYIVKKVK